MQKINIEFFFPKIKKVKSLKAVAVTRKVGGGVRGRREIITPSTDSSSAKIKINKNHLSPDLLAVTDDSQGKFPPPPKKKNVFNSPPVPHDQIIRTPPSLI